MFENVGLLGCSGLKQEWGAQLRRCVGNQNLSTPTSLTYIVANPLLQTANRKSLFSVLHRADMLFFYLVKLN